MILYSINPRKPTTLIIDLVTYNFSFIKEDLPPKKILEIEHNPSNNLEDTNLDDNIVKGDPLSEIRLPQNKVITIMLPIQEILEKETKVLKFDK